MNLFVEDVARKIETMEVRGAHRIAQAVAGALVQWAEDTEGTLEPDLGRNVRRLMKTRPTAVSLRNALALTLSGVDVEGEPTMARERIAGNGRSFILRSNSALARLSAIGSQSIKPGATVMTICNSTAAVMTMVKAHLGQGVEMVYSLETRPRRQGLITVRELAESGVPVTLVVDNAARYFLDDVDVVLTGADSVLGDGSVANKIGTSALAAQACEKGIPVYTCAETYKFHPGSLLGEELEIEERDAGEVWWGEPVPGVKVRNPSFDVTPARHITGIFTEKGMVAPKDAERVARELLEKDTYGIFNNEIQR